jgi:hypothetical protein
VSNVKDSESDIKKVEHIMLEAKPTAAGFPLASVLVAIRRLRTFTHGGVALAVVLVRLISSTPG